jgi:hypothetical protein
LSLNLFPCFSFSQSNYLVETSQLSIEPDQSLISLPLTGYGAPRDGRFTLQWVNRRAIPEISAMGGGSDKLYLISKGELLSVNPSENQSTWIKAGNAENILSIAGFGDKLYAINNLRELLETKIHGGIKWQKIGLVDNSVTVITASGNLLFAANLGGLLWSADLSKNRIEWKKVGAIINSISNIISLTLNNRKLYALTSDDVIYQCEPGNKDSKWLKIAYKNGETIKEDIKHITIVGGRIFGVSKDSYLYRGEHRSDGNRSARAMAI